MTLGYELASALGEMQADAESLMTETCTIAYPTDTEPDPATGEDVTTYGDPVYVGKCKVQDRNLEVREGESASSTADTTTKALHLPASAPMVRHGAVVTMSDGRMFRVLSSHRKTYQTAQRLAVEVTS